jgi:hypothetical protein
MAPQFTHCGSSPGVGFPHLSHLRKDTGELMLSMSLLTQTPFYKSCLMTSKIIMFIVSEPVSGCHYIHDNCPISIPESIFIMKLRRAWLDRQIELCSNQNNEHIAKLVPAC